MLLRALSILIFAIEGVLGAVVGLGGGGVLHDKGTRIPTAKLGISVTLTPSTF